MDSIDEIFATVPSEMLDSRCYYWRNFKYPGSKITYDPRQFLHTFPLGDFYEQNPIYVCSFDESLLITWIGIECSIDRRVATAYDISINVVNGMHPFSDNHINIFTYTKVPLPVNKFEPEFVHYILTSDRIDTGSKTHVRVHKGYNVELIHSYDDRHGSSLKNTKVVLKVQHSSRVGGKYDHHSWNKLSFRHSYNTKDIVSFHSYDRHVLKGDNALYYSS